MTQVVYIVPEPVKSSGHNPKKEYEGDFPPLRYVATNGQSMVKAMAAAWRENKIAKIALFSDGKRLIKVSMADIPTIISQNINKANQATDPIGWLMDIINDDKPTKE